MELSDFTANVAEQFEDVDANTITPATKFRELAEWSSIVALSIVGMIDEEYGITIKGDDIRVSNTIEDLFTIVSKKNA